MDAKTIHQFLLVLLGLFLHNTFFSLLQFLDNLLLNISRKSLLLISNSPYNLILSLFEPSLTIPLIGLL